MWFKKMVRRWVIDAAKEVDAGYELVEEYPREKISGDQIESQVPNLRICLYNAINGRVIQILTPIKAGTRGSISSIGNDTNFKSELYLLKEDEKLSAALTKLMLMKCDKYEEDS